MMQLTPVDELDRALDTPPEPARRTVFDRTTAIHPTGTPGVFDAELAPEWRSLVGILGGALVAIAVRGIETVVPGRTVRTVATSFFRPGQPGPARLLVKKVHGGRSVSSAVAQLYQDDRLLLTTRATLLGERTGIEWERRQPLVDIPPSACVPIVPPDRPLPHFDQAEGVLDPAGLPFTNGPRAAVRGYIRPNESRSIAAAWLAMASDWFPPPAFVRTEPPAGGVSIDLVTHIHRTRPIEPGAWLAGTFEVDTSSGGLAVEHGGIATRAGVLLAESFHTRWTAGPT